MVTWHSSSEVGAWVKAVAPVNSAVVPEPSTMLLLGYGLIGLASVGWMKFKELRLIQTADSHKGVVKTESRE